LIGCAEDFVDLGLRSDVMGERDPTKAGGVVVGDAAVRGELVAAHRTKALQPAWMNTVSSISCPRQPNAW
jgi:hypothetical protein